MIKAVLSRFLMKLVDKQSRAQLIKSKIGSYNPQNNEIFEQMRLKTPIKYYFLYMPLLLMSMFRSLMTVYMQWEEGSGSGKYCVWIQNEYAFGKREREKRERVV